MAERYIPPIPDSYFELDQSGILEGIRYGPTELILIGVLHDDIKGRERVTKALEHFKPDIVTVEYPDYMREFMEGLTQALDSPDNLESAVSWTAEKEQPNANKETLSALIKATFFEYVAASKYCEQNGIPLVLIDFNRPTNDIPTATRQVREDPTSGYNTSLDRALQGTAENYIASVDRGYERKHTSLLERGEARVREMQHRDDAMAEYLESTAGRVVHIGGLFHFELDYSQYGGTQNLLERLSYLKPTFLTLKEADNL